MELITDYLRKNPELKDNLKPGSEAQLIAKLSQNFTERAGELVDLKTNLAVPNMGALIQKEGRQFLKTRGEGKYIARFADRRTPQQRERDTEDFKKLLSEYASRLPNKYVNNNNEPERTLINTISNDFFYENDSSGSFYIVATLNGVPVERYTPEEVFSKLNKYLDPDKTKLADMEIKARIRNNALNLEGLTLSDLNDPKKKNAVDQTIKLLEKEYYSIATSKKLPSVNREEFESDLAKQGAHESGLPLSEAEWTLTDKIRLDAYASNLIERAKSEPWQRFNSFVNERTPEFYKSVFEKFSGLEY